LRHLPSNPLNLHLQTTRHLALLADDGRVVVQLDVVEENLQEYIGYANEIVVLLRLVERILRLGAVLVLWKSEIS